VWKKSKGTAQYYAVLFNGGGWLWVKREPRGARGEKNRKWKPGWGILVTKRGGGEGEHRPIKEKDREQAEGIKKVN